MLDEPFKYALLAALAIGLVVAALTDLHSRKIGNWLNAAIALGAPLFWFANGISVWPNMALQIGVAVATFTVCAALFAIRAMGGGDVKLLTALALWIAPALFVKLIVMMALLGGVLTLGFGAWHVMRRQKGRIAIPYGVAISLAGLWIMGTNYLPMEATTALG